MRIAGCFHRRLRAAGGSRDRLAVDAIDGIAGRKNGRSRCPCVPIRDDVAIAIQIDGSPEEPRVRYVADVWEDRVGREDLLGARVDMLQPDCFDRAVAQDLGHHRIPDEFQFRMTERPILEDRVGTERITAMDNVDVAGKARQEKGLFNRTVAAADHHDPLVPEEEAVADCTVRDTTVGQALLARDTELARRRARRDDDGVSCERFTIVQGDAVPHRCAL